MAQKLSLRAYLENLDRLLSGSATDEVIFHCRHLLHTLPKNVDVYRTLGRALLYNSRWNEAGPVLRRVLSVYPDDYVAHIGLSESYHQQQRGDYAIWHLERAFDHEPNNPQLIATLREFYRHYRQTDVGRLQLTASAVARQYLVQGRCQEAVDTLRGALQRSPNRLDLQVLMIDALWQNDQRLDAAEMALDLLETLPDALVPNRVLAEFWLAEQRASDAQRFVTRIEAVEPYRALALVAGEAVPDEALLVEEADYRRYMEEVVMNDQPDWLREIAGEEYTGLLRDEADADAPTTRVPSDWLSQTDELRLQRTTALPSAREANPDVDLSFVDTLDEIAEEEATVSSAVRDLDELTPSLARGISRPREQATPLEMPDWLANPGEPMAEETADADVPADDGEDPMAWLRETGISIDDSAPRARLLYDQETEFEHQPVSPDAWLEQSGIEVLPVADEARTTRAPTPLPPIELPLEFEAAAEEPLTSSEEFPDFQFETTPPMPQGSAFELEESDDFSLNWFDTIEDAASQPARLPGTEALVGFEDPPPPPQPQSTAPEADDFGWLSEPTLVAALETVRQTRPAARASSTDLDATEPAGEPDDSAR